MRFLPPTAASLFLLAFTASAAAQSGSVYVNQERVNAALAKGGVLSAAPQVQFAGGHRDKPGALETSQGSHVGMADGTEEYHTITDQLADLARALTDRPGRTSGL